MQVLAGWDLGRSMSELMGLKSSLKLSSLNWTTEGTDYLYQYIICFNIRYICGICHGLSYIIPMIDIIKDESLYRTITYYGVF